MTGTPGAEATGSADEPVEVLGPDGAVTGVVPRRRMRAEGLAHRATYVITILAAPPPRVVVNGSTSEWLERWLAAVDWPLLGPERDERPVLVPPSRRPALLSPATPMIVHQRADWKDVYPCYWDLAFGGVCAVGEPWLESAERELAEEAGLSTNRMATGSAIESTASVVPIAAGRYADGRSETFGVVFVAFTDHEPDPVDGEVVAFDLIPIGDVADWAGNHAVCPDSTSLVVPVVSGLIDSAVL